MRYIILVFVLFFVHLAEAGKLADEMKSLGAELVASEKEVDAKLETAILKTLPDYDQEMKASSDSPVRYFYNRIDLNGDKTPETVVYLKGAYVCGSGGCNAFVFQNSKDGYSLVTQFTLAQTPIVVSDHATNGWNDLIFYVSGGGMKGAYKVLQYNGKTYPKNPSVVGKEVGAKEKLAGKALMYDGDEGPGKVLPAW